MDFEIQNVKKYNIIGQMGVVIGTYLMNYFVGHQSTYSYIL